MLKVEINQSQFLHASRSHLHLLIPSLHQALQIKIERTQSVLSLFFFFINLFQHANILYSVKSVVVQIM